MLLSMMHEEKFWKTDVIESYNQTKGTVDARDKN